MAGEPSRLPWEIVETLPGSDATRLAEWTDRVAGARSREERSRALIGLALSSYWVVQAGVVDEPWAIVAARRADQVDEALDLARQVDDPDLVAEALLGQLHANWGPDHLDLRPAIVAELDALHPAVGSEELRYQIRSWTVLAAFDAGDTAGADAAIDRLAGECAGTDLVLFPRRVRLWRANLAMLTGAIDEAVAANQAALGDTASTAGAPFSFQNAMVTFGIERFLRRELADVVDPVRSVRASSPRVGANWEVALAFALAESGRLDEAAAIFDGIASDPDAVPRDLNWLVVTVLLGLIAADLDDRARIAAIHDRLAPYAALDATHGSGYASYGPVGRVVGMLAARRGLLDVARDVLGEVLATRSDGPWTSLTRLELARTGGPDAAAVAERAAVELTGLGLDAWAAEARRLERASEVGRTVRPVARRDGTSWSLLHPAGRATVAHSRGVELLAVLLTRPGRPLHVLDLDGIDRSLPRTGTFEPVLDDRARRSFRRRLEELERRPRRSAADDEEVAALRRALAGGAHAPSSSAELERARVRVTKALRRTIAAVEAASPGLGAHLTAAVTTGRTCLYAPVAGEAWTIEDDR